MPTPPPVCRPGLTRYVLTRNPLTNAVEKVLPGDLGVVHALSIRRWEPTPRFPGPHYLDVHKAAPGGLRRAGQGDDAGTSEPSDPDACQTCAGQLPSAQQS